MHSENSPVTAAQQSRDLSLVFVALSSTTSDAPQLVDAVFKDAEGCFRGYYSGKTITELATEYERSGEVKMMRMTEYNKLHDDALRTEPEEITEQAYWQALEVLPPMKWHTLRGVESFRMSEFYSGSMTAIYAKCDGRYWTFRDDAYMDASALVDKVRAAMEVQAA